MVAVVGGEEVKVGSGAEIDIDARRAAARVLYVAATRATQRLILGGVRKV